MNKQLGNSDGQKNYEAKVDGPSVFLAGFAQRMIQVHWRIYRVSNIAVTDTSRKVTQRHAKVGGNEYRNWILTLAYLCVPLREASVRPRERVPSLEINPIPQLRFAPEFHRLDGFGVSDGTTDAGPAHLEEVAHLALQVGRLLLENGADTAQVQESIVGFAAAFGYEAHLIVTYEALLLTIVTGNQFRTKVGYRVPGMNVNMAAVVSVNRLLGEVKNGRLSLAEGRAELADIEQRPTLYNRWIVVVALGLTAASLARLFSSDWPAFGVAWLAGSAGMWLRQGIDLVSGTLIGALVVGFLAQGFSWRFRAPSAAFAFPGVVAMIPGAFAFRAVIGSLQIVHAGAAAAPVLVTETLALAAACVLMVAAIAVGIAAPLILTRKGTTEPNHLSMHPSMPSKH